MPEDSSLTEAAPKVCLNQRAPAIRDKSSSEYQAFSQANAELVRNIPTLWQSARAPEIVSEYLALRVQAGQAETLAQTNKKLEAENQELKRRLGLVQSPLPPRQPTQQTDVEQTAEQMLRSNLRQLGIS